MRCWPGNDDLHINSYCGMILETSLRKKEKGKARKPMHGMSMSKLHQSYWGSLAPSPLAVYWSHSCLHWEESLASVLLRLRTTPGSINYLELPPVSVGSGHTSWSKKYHWQEVASSWKADCRLKRIWMDSDNTCYSIHPQCCPSGQTYFNEILWDN